MNENWDKSSAGKIRLSKLAGLEILQLDLIGAVRIEYRETPEAAVQALQLALTAEQLRQIARGLSHLADALEPKGKA